MRLLWISACVAFLLDQISKYVVVHVMGVNGGRVVDVLPPVIRFIYGENRGINFGLFSGVVPVWVLVTIALAICVGVLVWTWRVPQPPLARVCAGLLIGGALGNVLDRLIYGYVLDFLNSSCCGWNNPSVYNVGDIFIFIGAIGLVFLGQETRKGKKGA